MKATSFGRALLGSGHSHGHIGDDLGTAQARRDALLREPAAVGANAAARELRLSADVGAGDALTELAMAAREVRARRFRAAPDHAKHLTGLQAVGQGAQLVGQRHRPLEVGNLGRIGTTYDDAEYFGSFVEGRCTGTGERS